LGGTMLFCEQWISHWDHRPLAQKEFVHVRAMHFQMTRRAVLEAGAA